MAVEFRNVGEATAVFQVRSADAATDPRSYTVEPGSDTWDAHGYDLTVFGPNGFFREFTASRGVTAQHLEVRAAYDESHEEITLRIRNASNERVTLSVRDHYAATVRTVVVRPHSVERERWSLRRLRGWYDLGVTASGDPGFSLRYAGHLENGEDSISDPGMGGLI